MRRQKKNTRQAQIDKARAIFRKRGGILRTAQALRLGIHPSVLYAMRDSGDLEQVSRGVYRLSDTSPLGDPDLVIVATRVPKGVICLISALSFHELTTQIPHEIHLALPRGAEEPRLEYPPLRTYRFSDRTLREGVETHEIDSVRVRIYNAEKTIADCFKFRNRIGLDTAVEAVRLYRERRRVDVNQLMHYAEICRVEKVIRPYLEVLF
jgi:predicted transcriptional regulator of viral defense system